MEETQNNQTTAQPSNITPTQEPQQTSSQVPDNTTTPKMTVDAPKNNTKLILVSLLFVLIIAGIAGFLMYKTKQTNMLKEDTTQTSQDSESTSPAAKQDDDDLKIDLEDTDFEGIVKDIKSLGDDIEAL